MFTLAYDITVASATDLAIILWWFLAGSFGAYGLALVGPILVYNFIHKKEIINLAFAIAIGFTIGFTFGQVLIFSILDLI